MLQKTIQSQVGVLLSGLMLAACGGVTEAELAREERLGTQESALCTGLGVDNVSISGVSSYNYEAAGSGEWQVSMGANAVRLEYYVDGTLYSFEERVGATGTWYFSASPMSCGPHTFEVKAYPMVVDSAGNRTTCMDAPNSADQAFEQYCAPTASVSCGRPGTSLHCTGTAAGGSYSYTRYWQTVITDLDVGDEPMEGSWVAGTSTKDFYCPPITLGAPYYWKQIRFKVVDSVGTTSNIASTMNFKCAR
ncbi:hypothetical protein ATI61_110224 [Archangium gephyra]|uniref:Lipoprotein n=1 Tax=Archangium gephyra TaxID=48 RepID=A0AAC8TIW3_9BACT|nr:hypothetical protein [Archangium gephyra]AKJ06031.1 Hypothetical protein AA314_07657 [Archangium gephyra]REG27217.1 hypothetical protein ATI61_110224 [Archangium gephyra]